VPFFRRKKRLSSPGEKKILQYLHHRGTVDRAKEKKTKEVSARKKRTPLRAWTRAVDTRKRRYFRKSGPTAAAIGGPRRKSDMSLSFKEKAAATAGGREGRREVERKSPGFAKKRARAKEGKERGVRLAERIGEA